MKQFQISEDGLNKILAYVQRQPWNEVQEVMSILLGVIQTAQAPVVPVVEEVEKKK